MADTRPPLVIDAEGMLEAPGEAGTWSTFIHTGARLAAWPAPTGDGGILLLRGGIVDGPGFEPEMLAVSLSAEGLLYLSGDINQLVMEILGHEPAPQPDRPKLPGDVVNALVAASHALRSYQHGNSATDLAAGVAGLLDQTLERFGHSRSAAPIDAGSVI